MTLPDQLRQALEELREPFATDDAEPYWLGPPAFNTMVAAARSWLRLLPDSRGIFTPTIVEQLREAIRSTLVEVVSVELEPSQFETTLDEITRDVLHALVGEGE